MRPAITFITLGVADVARATAFYEQLGFRAHASSQPSITFFDLGSVALSLYGRDALAADATVEPSAPGSSGVTLAHCVGSEAEVDAVLQDAVAAGGRLVKAAHKAFWGGYSGYFADLDGHLWEVAHNPCLALGEDGRYRLADNA